MAKDTTQGVPSGYRVKLSVSERLNLGALLPPKGNQITMQLMEDITEKIQLSQKEMDLINLKFIEVPTPKGLTTRSTWDPKKAKDKPVEFTKTEMRFLKKRIEKLDKDEDITPNVWPLVKKLDAFKVSEERKE